MRQKEPDYNKKAIMSHLLGSVIIIFFSFLHFIIARRRFEAWIPVPTCSRSAALLKVCAVCMSRQSQILFLSDVGIFIVHVWCATQTRPQFNVPSKRCLTYPLYFKFCCASCFKLPQSILRCSDGTLNRGLVCVAHQTWTIKIPTSLRKRICDCRLI